MDSLWEELFGEPDPLGLEFGQLDSPQLPFAQDSLDIEPLDVSPPSPPIPVSVPSPVTPGQTDAPDIPSQIGEDDSPSIANLDPVAIWGPGILILENALRQHPELYTSLAASITQNREEARMKEEEDTLVERARAMAINSKPASPPTSRIFIPQERTYNDPMGKFYRAPPAQVTCDWTGANGRCGELFDLDIFADITTYMRAIDLHMADHISDLTMEGASAKDVLPGRLVRCHWPDCQWAPRKPGGLARHIRTSHTLTDMVRCQRCHHPFVVNQKCNTDRHEPRHCKTDEKSISSNLRTVPRGVKYRKSS